MREKSERPLSLFSLITVLVGINVGANFIAVLSLTFLSPLIRRPSDSVLIQEISGGIGGIIGANPISFGVPTLIAILHLLPLIRVAGGGQYSQALLETAKKRLLDVPLVQASVSFIGWLIGTLEPFYRAYLKQVDLPLSLSISLVVNSAVFAILCFVIVYFSLEFSIRKLFIPSLFPDGRLSEYKSVINLSIRSRFFIFYFAVTVFPVFLLYSVLVAKIDQSELERLFAPLTILAAVLLAVGALITYLVSGSYHTPLVAMKKSTGQIRSGNYDIKTPVLSNDEVGNLAEGLNEMAEGLKEKEFIKDTFGKMVDPSVRDYLLQGNLNLGGEIREATVLFSDIRGFTTLSEKMRPDEVVHLLNRYFDKISSCIQEEGGLVSKYIGDAVMAVFGVPIPLENHSLAALKAALKMRVALHSLNQELRSEGLPEIRSGTGIHTGYVLAGNIGSPNRMEYTVIGDAVNLASRIEELCKEFGCDLIISEAISERLGGGLRTRYLETVRVRGKEESVRLFIPDFGLEDIRL